MKKIRLTMTIEYIPVPENYPDCKTIEEMMAVDMEDDPFHLFDNAKIHGEIVDD